MAIKYFKEYQIDNPSNYYIIRVDNNGYCFVKNSHNWRATGHKWCYLREIINQDRYWKYIKMSEQEAFIELL